MTESLPTPDFEEKNSHFSLRPESLEEFAGQTKIKERLFIMIQAAKEREDVLNHILFCGPPGLGKTTLSRIIAKAVNADIHQASGPQIEKSADLVGVLTNLKYGDVLFIDEIHRLHPSIEEYLYSAMEDFTVDIMIDSGPAARSIQLNIPKFTLIGATTRLGMMSSPLRSRFDLVNRLENYSLEELSLVVNRSANLLEISIDEGGEKEISQRARGAPRTVNTLLRWMRDYAQVKKKEKIDAQFVKEGMQILEIDEDGLNETDHDIIKCIIHQFNGGPVGINSLALALGEDSVSIGDIHEPFLLAKGFIQRTPQGRIASESAYQKIGEKFDSKNRQNDLL